MIRRPMICAVLPLIIPAGIASAEPARFGSPEAAVAAVIAALEAGGREAVLEVFGPENEDILSTGEPEEDRALWDKFLKDVRAVSRIERESADRASLYAGRERWPFPAALVLSDGAWSFDAEGAREEVLMRRIGQNELAAIDVLQQAGEGASGLSPDRS